MQIISKRLIDNHEQMTFINETKLLNCEFTFEYLESQRKLQIP